jgi:phosphatidate cytidylyltransferase
MRTRVISGIVAGAAVCAIILIGKEVFDIACAALACIAVYELFSAFKQKGYKPLILAGYVSCACLLLGSIGTWNRRIWKPLLNAIQFIDIRVLLYLALITMFCLMIFSKGRFSMSDLAITIFCSLYVCFLFWFLILVRVHPNGAYCIWFVVIGAVATDIGAYFSGTLLGKRKLIPDVSPNKTVEGVIGGIVTCTAAIVAYGFIYNYITPMAAEGAAVVGEIAWGAFTPIPIWKTLIVGLLCGVIAQIGDLAASSIKRFCGIKDFGHVLPGHGGVLDRLDSVLILAPLIQFMFT